MMPVRSAQDLLVCLFFFSSRRRHTRCSRDWSSDVCSSDLVAYVHESGAPVMAHEAQEFPTLEQPSGKEIDVDELPIADDNPKILTIVLAEWALWSPVRRDEAR